jgi:hypothetical protein
VLEQQLHDGGMALLGCPPDGLIVISMHVGAVLDKERNHISVAIL